MRRAARIWGWVSHIDTIFGLSQLGSWKLVSSVLSASAVVAVGAWQSMGPVGLFLAVLAAIGLGLWIPNEVAARRLRQPPEPQSEEQVPELPQSRAGIRVAAPGAVLMGNEVQGYDEGMVVEESAEQFRGIGNVVAETPDTSPRDASIRFHLYGDERTPQRLDFENVWRWFYLRTLQRTITDATPGDYQTLNTIFFLTFDRPVTIGTLEISSPDFDLPQYEVKDFDVRSAVVVFSGALPMGTLEMRVRQ